jgi:hypothetical protein
VIGLCRVSFQDAKLTKNVPHATIFFPLELFDDVSYEVKSLENLKKVLSNTLQEFKHHSRGKKQFPSGSVQKVPGNGALAPRVATMMQRSCLR